MGNVLYRKYRSRSFDEIIGQPHVVQTLKNALKQGRVAHAYLLTGPRGVGKTSVARIIASEVNQISSDETSNHLDVIEIDAASNRRIDEIRELRDKVHSAPAQATYKVYIIDEVHMLTKEAFNALLKTLEEPPAHVIFVLATTEAHKLPDTIVSRTQKFTFKPISETAIQTHLRSIADKESIGISDDALALIARHGQGSFRDSLSLLDQASHITPADKAKSISADDIGGLVGAPSKDAVAELIQALENKDVTSALQTITDLYGKGFDPTYIAQEIAAELRGAIIASSSATSDTTSLLRELLSVKGSHDSYTALEIALLDYCATAATQSAVPLAQNTETSEGKPKKTKHKSEVTKTKETNAETKTEKAKTVPRKSAEDKTATKIIDTNNVDLDAKTVWEHVLHELKGKHNTLYGMARMAEPEIHGETFELACKYGFHVRRLMDSQHKRIIEDALFTVTEKTLLIECTQAKKPTKKTSNEPTDRPEIKKDDEPIETISNIFGSAEVLES